jgi:L-ascorbate 6-phosphate lactonase
MVGNDNSMRSDAFMDLINNYQVPGSSIAIWTLGQNGFLLKTPEGTRIVIDPYLTNHCATLNEEYGLDFGRVLPVFIEPEDLCADLILLTHSHRDHTDPETIRRFVRKDDAFFMAPWQAWAMLPEFGVAPERTRLIHPLETHEFRDLRIAGTLSIPTDGSDLNHLGFILEFSNGIRFYNSGDTAYHELLGHIRSFEPQIMSICINGGFHNLSHWDAARITGLINPAAVIPAHYDMMVCNRQDPSMFAHSLKAQGVASRFTLLNYYEPFIFTI